MNDFATRWVNLASAKLGAEAVACSDDFFAPMARMLQDAAPIFIDGKYDEHGKWMDGWESRRKRVAGHDWCVVRLARPGVIRGLDIDTTHFTGNYPPGASVDACNFDGGDGDAPGDDADWHEVIARVDLRGDSGHAFEVGNENVFTHVRLNIFPDGGVARLRVYGEPKVDWAKLTAAADDGLVDLAASLNGAVALVCNDQHFGDKRNLLTPGRGVDMGDGWETRRRREPGNDWVVIALAQAGQVARVEVDTAHFKGNYPDRCSLQAARLSAADATVAADELARGSESWPQLLPQVKLEADREHEFTALADLGPVTHVRLNIYPDGGVSRLRLFGKVENPEDAA